MKGPCLNLFQQGGERFYLFRMGICHIVFFRRIDGKIVQLGLRGVSHFRLGPILQCGFVAGLYVFPVSLDNGECIVQILLYNIVTSGSVGSQEVVELVAAVGSVGFLMSF